MFTNPQNMQVSSKSGVLIGIPTLGRPVSLEWASAYKSLNPPINYNMTVMQVNGQPVAVARNAMAREALRLEAKYLFFLGDDVIVPPHTLKQLIFRLESDSNIGVVGGVYCSKSNPPAPLVFRGNGQGSYWDWKIGEYFEVTGLGMDATLIRTSIFNEIPEPWFKTEDSDGFAEGINKAEQTTEDLYFLKKVSSKTGYSIFCDASLICDHVDVFSGNKFTLPAKSLPTRVAAKEVKQVIDIGCGPLKLEIEDVKALRVDIREDVKPDYRCDVRSLPFADFTFDIVYSSHVLEHFSRGEWKDVLKEWVRLVKPKGKIILNLPNITWAARRIVEDNIIDEDVLNVLYGAQSYAYDFHYNGLTPERVELALRELGMKPISCELSSYNMKIEAVRGLDS